MRRSFQHYLTSVRDGGFYGWPYCYWDRVVDNRVPQDAAQVASAITPDYALGCHTAPLGLCWLPAGTLPGFPEGMAIGQHGSWNRSILSGYKLVFIPFADGHPDGPPRDILTGFLLLDERESYGRPAGVHMGPDGAVLMVDDVGGIVWHVTRGLGGVDKADRHADGGELDEAEEAAGGVVIAGSGGGSSSGG